MKRISFKPIAFFQISFCLLFISTISNAQIVSTFAGSSLPGNVNASGIAARFYHSESIAIDANGNIFVADNGNNEIRKISPAGVVTTLAGNGSVGNTNGTGANANFNAPSGIAIDANANLYVADYNNDLIRKVTPTGVVTTFAGSGSTGSADGLGTAASFNKPYGIAVDINGNVYVGDCYNCKIRKITPTGLVSTLAGTGYSGSANGAGNVASFNHPAGVAVDASGNVYVADELNHVIRKITSTGVVSTFAGNGTIGSTNGNGNVASFYNPVSIGIDASGNLYVVEFGNHLIRKISNTAVVSTFAGTGIAGNINGNISVASFNGPTGLVLKSNGDIFIAEYYGNDIRRITNCSPSSDTIYQTICQGNSYVFNGQTLTNEGMYLDSFKNSNGCDSLITLKLSFFSPINVFISQTGNLLSTLSGMTYYQWYLNGNPITGANSATFMPSVNGNYTVKVTSSNNCSQTSSIFKVSNVSVNNYYLTNNTITIYPNPTHTSFQFSTKKPLNISLYNTLGQIVLLTGTSANPITANAEVNIAYLPTGLYIIRETNSGLIIGKIMKE